MHFRNISRIFLCTIALASPSCLQAKEVDQFTDRLTELEHLHDGSAAADAHMNALLRRIESRLPVGAKTLRDKALIPIVFDVFQGNIFSEFRTPFEFWLRDDADIDLYWVDRMGIYGGDVNFDDMGLGWYVEIAPVMRMGPHLIGIDKVGHFLGQGWYYYDFYQNYAKTHPDVGQAEIEEKIREYGDSLESTHLGSTASGVYSYGDLAANWQGFQFLRSLFHGKNPYFKRSPDGKYQLVRAFHFLDYVTDDWDELINPSRLHSKDFYDKVARNVQRVSCSDFKKDPVQYLNLSGRVMRRQDYVWSGAAAKEAEEPYFIDLNKICAAEEVTLELPHNKAL